VQMPGQCVNITIFPENPFMRALMAATACVLLISACGIKGPLYLPPADPTPAGSPPAEAPPADIDPSPIDSPE